MRTGILIIESTEFIQRNNYNTEKISKTLSYKGYDVKIILQVESKCEIETSVEYMKKYTDAILILGNKDVFYDAMSKNFNINKTLDVLEIDSTIFAFVPNDADEFITNTVIPALNSKCKTFYNTFIFKTFDKSEHELKEILKDQIKNKNRIAFRFIPSLLECEVQIKFSSKTSQPVVDSIILKVAELLKDITYANSDVTLAYQVADILKVQNKKICIAESFTGGGIASELIAIEGISSVLKEGIVCYSNESKINRLNVEPNIIQHYGAVSIETVYEMAANILIKNNCDISVATTGNAGPTSEKVGQVGLCFIAIGNRKGIHIYKYNFDGDRETVIKSGIKAALFQLYYKLNESEFAELLNIHENAK